MARRRGTAATVAVEAPPEWVTSTLAGLVKFNGNGAAWGRARAQWCADNRCRRLVPCSPWGRAQCEVSRGAA